MSKKVRDDDKVTMEHGIIPTSVNEFEKLAEEKMAKDKKHRALWCYIGLGTGDKQTLEDSKAAFRRFRFQPRILTAKRERSTQTTLLGNPVSLPIGISPVAGYSSVHPYGATLAGKAAARAGAVMILGSVGNISLEDFAERVPSDGLYWAQTYLFRDKRNTLRLVRNAERLGFKALVVTVDSPVEHKGAGSNKETMDEYTRTVVETPAANIRYVNGKEREISPASLSEVWTEAYKEVFCCANWEDLSWLQSETKLPIILKGVLSVEAALMAKKSGIAGILVSAHGGRQLDGVPAPLDALPDIVDAVKDTNIEVYMDGGVRTGNDVFKALALGARAVFVGRPSLWGVAVNGEDGVYQILKILEDELQICMALCGCSSLSEITRSLVKHESQFHANF